MSQLVSRILLSILMLPLATVLYILTFMVAVYSSRGGGGGYEPVYFAFAGVITWVFVAIYWLVLWGNTIKWTTSRKALTGTAAAVLVGAVVVVASLLALGHSPDAPMLAIFIGSILAILLWLVSTIIVWRETPEERSARIRGAGRGGVSCPTCGYNLTGLTEARCPECGAKFTIDELLAAQPSQAMREIEGV